MAMRKLQLYVTEEQYRLLRRRAGDARSIAQVVRDMIDAAHRPDGQDSFMEHVRSPKAGSGEAYDAADAKRDLYRGRV